MLVTGIFSFSYNVFQRLLPRGRLKLGFGGKELICDSDIYSHKINPLPNNKILDVTKLKAFADDNLNFSKMTISLLDRIENTVGKGENNLRKKPFENIVRKGENAGNLSSFKTLDYLYFA